MITPSRFLNYTLALRASGPLVLFTQFLQLFLGFFITFANVRRLFANRAGDFAAFPTFPQIRRVCRRRNECVASAVSAVGRIRGCHFLQPQIVGLGKVLFEKAVVSREGYWDVPLAALEGGLRLV